ncbi:MAG: RES family NAD+ phosphorylase [Chthoniobacterales bacterium]|nr:RES family NAD+ phosphorylase [Chthoniobacterales bacterium]
MHLHPRRDEFAERVRALGRKHDRALQADLFRFIDPRFSRAADIVSGAGALQASGRWHVKGQFRISYTSMDPETALAEALATARYYHLPVSSALPRVLVSLRLTAPRVLDLRVAAIGQTLKFSGKGATTTDWRQENQSDREAATQAWGAAFQQAGFEAVIVPSAAREVGTNVIVFSEALLRGSHFRAAREVRWPK